MATSITAASVRAWIERWGARQAVYVPDRVETLTLMLDLVAERFPAPRRILDLGPVLLALARGGVFVDALRAAGFAEVATLKRVARRRLLAAIR